MFQMDGSPYASNTTTISDIEVPAASVTHIWRFPATAPSGVFFIRLKLFDEEGHLLSENFYWKNKAGNKNDFTALNTLPKAELRCKTISNPSPLSNNLKEMTIEVSNLSSTTAFGIRVRLVDAATGRRILPVTMEENYFTLFAGESRTLHLVYEATSEGLPSVTPLVLLKQYGYPETDADGNPAGINPISYPSQEEKEGLYDMQGRPLNVVSTAELPTGYYIQKNGTSRRVYLVR